MEATANWKGTKAGFAEAQRSKVVFKSPVEEETVVELMDRMLQDAEVLGLAELVVKAYVHGYDLGQKLLGGEVWPKDVRYAINVWVALRDCEFGLTHAQMLFLTHWSYVGANMREQAESSKKAYEKELEFSRCLPIVKLDWPSRGFSANNNG